MYIFQAKFTLIEQKMQGCFPNNTFDTFKLLLFMILAFWQLFSKWGKFPANI